MAKITPWTPGLLVLLLPACSDLPMVFDPLDAVRVEITAGSCGASAPRVIMDRECELEAKAFDDNSREVRAGFAWSTGNPSIATVSPKPGFDTTVAEITGVEVGETTIRVELAGSSDVFAVRDLTVIPPNDKDL